MKVKIGDWQGELSFTVVPLDDYKVVLGLKFFRKVNVFPIPKVNFLVIIDETMMRVIPLKLIEKTILVISALQLEKELKSGGYNATSMVVDDSDDSTSPPETTPDPVTLPKEPPSKCKVDKAIELGPGARTLEMTPCGSTSLIVNLFRSGLLDRVQRTKRRMH